MEDKDDQEWFFPLAFLVLFVVALAMLVRGERNSITTVVGIVSAVAGGLTVIRRELGFSLGEDGPWTTICRGLPAVVAGVLLLSLATFILVT
jgi:drug/metabolite transporter (DMT)-like permease